MTSRPRATLTRELIELLESIGGRMRERMYEAMAELHLTPPLAGALRALEQPMQMSGLAERLSCDASYVTGLADELERRGLVERRPDPDDRRVKNLVLTEAGRDLRRRLHREIHRGHDWFERLEDDQLATLVDLLRAALVVDPSPT